MRLYTVSKNPDYSDFKGHGWVRLGRYGPGMSWAPAGSFRYFSERSGHIKTLTIAGKRFRFLRSLW